MIENNLNDNNFPILNPALFIVATPIGNLEDITFRAIKILKSVDCILCEDTRVTAKLLNFYNIKTALVQFDDHASNTQIEKCISMLMSGKSLALVSDAGTPLISDPGYRIIREAINNDIKVESLPGPSSVINALVLSGLKNNTFTFLGFLPHELSAKEKMLLKYKSIDTTLIFFENSNRLLSTLEIINKHFSSSRVCIAREMTKRFEEINRSNVVELLNEYGRREKIKGEIVVLVESIFENSYEEDKIKDIIKQMLSEKVSSKDISIEICQAFNVSKKQVYELILALKKL